MALLIVYAVMVSIGEIFAAALGIYLDRVSAAWSLPIALVLVFSVIAISWPLAVFVTDRWLPEKLPQK